MPSSWLSKSTGFVNGPIRLKMVGTRKSRRTFTIRLVFGWTCGANRKVIPSLCKSSSDARGGKFKLMPSSSKTSALPDLLDTLRLPCLATGIPAPAMTKRSEEHTSELQSREKLVCRLLLEKKNEKR